MLASRLFKARRCFSLLGDSLRTADPEMHSIFLKEVDRQTSSIDLIASENFVSNPVYEALGATIQNKDRVVPLAASRALELFRLDPEKWGVSVVSLSGAPANFNAYNAVLDVGDRVMGLRLNCGGVG